MALFAGDVAGRNGFLRRGEIDLVLEIGQVGARRAMEFMGIAVADEGFGLGLGGASRLACRFGGRLARGGSFGG